LTSIFDESVSGALSAVSPGDAVSAGTGKQNDLFSSKKAASVEGGSLAEGHG